VPLKLVQVFAAVVRVFAKSTAWNSLTLGGTGKMMRKHFVWRHHISEKE
jgi:hypothetical protein